MKHFVLLLSLIYENVRDVHIFFFSSFLVIILLCTINVYLMGQKPVADMPNVALLL